MDVKIKPPSVEEAQEDFDTPVSPNFVENNCAWKCKEIMDICISLDLDGD